MNEIMINILFLPTCFTYNIFNLVLLNNPYSNNIKCLILSSRAKINLSLLIEPNTKWFRPAEVLCKMS